MKDCRSHLIAAVDVAGRSAAVDAVERLTGHVGFFKIGLELFVSEGPPIVREFTDRGQKVFLDLKLHDIPNTVAGAVRSACRLGVSMITIHAAGGRKMMEAARLAAETTDVPPLLLAVTALTSLNSEDAQRMGIQESLAEWSGRLADLAHEAKIGGVVCSALELPLLRKRLGKGMKYVVPGIRPAGAAAQDQARVASPAEAITAGADFLVVGRPILGADDPAEAADAILAEITGAL